MLGTAVVREAVGGLDACTPQQGAEERGFRLSRYDFDDNELVHA
jgi:hypothetical protein